MNHRWTQHARAFFWLATATAATTPGVSQATLIYKTALIDELQIESHESLGREDVAWVKLTGSWEAVNCLADWGWFNSETSPQLLAAASRLEPLGHRFESTSKMACPSSMGIARSRL
jgi:hypothetical protein